MQNPASYLTYFAIEILCDKSGGAVQNIKSSPINYGNVLKSDSFCASYVNFPDTRVKHDVNIIRDDLPPSRLHCSSEVYYNVS